MSKQITVRLSDDLVAFLDGEIHMGGVSGRAEVVSRALRNERRRLAGERDAKIYAELGEDEDLAEFSTAAARTTWGRHE